MSDPCIAVIPAKILSTRIPRKNILPLAGKPLFMHSVQYALNEGVTPVVSTDSPEIIKICEQHNVRTVLESVDESNMFYCIKNVALQFPEAKKIAVLQPTSPFRQGGLLRKMMEKLDDGNFHSVYTAYKVKVIGQLDGKFQYAYRDQDTSRWLYHFDGNIVVCNTEEMLKREALFSDDSFPLSEDYPYSMQIDTPPHRAIIGRMAEMPAFAHALPFEKKPSIVIVSNKTNHLRDYSAFVDSCDIVVRVNNMANYDSGLTGKKTDIAVVGVNPLYLCKDKSLSHIDVALNTPLVYLHYVQSECVSEFLDKSPKGDVMFLPMDVKQEGAEWTTFGRATKIMHELYPDVKLKLLADKHVISRSDATLCQLSTEDSVLDSWEEQGFIEYVLEETKTEDFKYSTPIPQDNVEYRTRAALMTDYDNTPGEEIECVSPQWTSHVKIADNGVVCRKDNGFCGYILERKGDNLNIWWDGMAEEPFVKSEQGVYVSVIPSGKSLYR